MKILTSRVTNGQLDVPEGTWHEGDTVTLLVPESDDDTFTLSAEQREFLRGAMAEARRGEGVDGWKLLDELES